jgi:hypothetical protein
MACGSDDRQKLKPTAGEGVLGLIRQVPVASELALMSIGSMVNNPLLLQDKRFGELSILRTQVEEQGPVSGSRGLPA